MGGVGLQLPGTLSHTDPAHPCWRTASSVTVSLARTAQETGGLEVQRETCPLQATPSDGPAPAGVYPTALFSLLRLIELSVF